MATSDKPLAGLDPMTVVIRTNNMGDIIGVFTALPIKVIKVDGDLKGGEIPTKNLLALDTQQTEAVREILDTWGHLTPEQLDKIKKTACEELLMHCKENAGYTKGVIESYVARMEIEDQIECISEDEDQVGELLGFVPETGEPYLNDEERLERMSDDEHLQAQLDGAEDDFPDQLAWVPALPQGEYHWLRSPAEEPADRTHPERTATVACGARIKFEAARVDGVPCTTLPYSHSGWCGACRDAVTAAYGTEPAVPAALTTPEPPRPKKRTRLWWGRTNVGTSKTWHAFEDEPVALPREKSTISKHFKMRKFSGNSMCGAAGMHVVGVSDMPLRDQPHPSEKSGLCPMCVGLVTKLREGK